MNAITSPLLVSLEAARDFVANSACTLDTPFKVSPADLRLSTRSDLPKTTEREE